MSSTTNPTPPINRRMVYLAIVICLGITGFLYWSEINSSDTETTALKWTGRAILFLALGLVMMACRDLAYMIRIRQLTDNRLTWRQSLNVILLWEFASAISPGVVGGSAVALFILRKEKIPIGQSTALVIITLIFDNLFYILFIPAVFLFVDVSALFPESFDWASSGMRLFWIGYTLIVGINLILVLSVFYSPRIIHFFVRLIYKLPYLNRRQEQAQQFAQDIETASITMRDKSAGYWLRLFGLTVWSWISRFLVINCVLLAFIELGLIDQLIILARQLVMWLAMLVTPTPGGSGMAEYAFSALFSDYTLNAAVSAVSLGLIWRTISYYPYLLIGSILLPRWLSK